MSNAPIHSVPSPGPAGRLELNITSDPANLRHVRKEVEQFAAAAGLPKDACDAVGLCVNEALANVIRHGYHEAKDRPIVLTADAQADGVTITIRDWATPWDPSKVPPKKKGSLEPGGLGLLCLKSLMDEVEFVQLADGMLLKMRKLRKKPNRNG